MIYCEKDSQGICYPIKQHHNNEYEIYLSRYWRNWKSSIKKKRHDKGRGKDCSKGKKKTETKHIKKRAVRNEDLRLEIKKRLKKMVVLNVYERISVKVDGHREWAMWGANG